ncbi:MAG: hypothetical protein KL863_20590 [Rhizobium sp.]|nr:hypothetical protein [Rhizobium sp.]
MDGRTEPDDLTRATVTVAWVIILNKPFYPLYVWWLVGSGVEASLGTLIATPFFLAIALLAPRGPLAARLGLPLAGAIDTIIATKFIGFSTGTLLFLAPCMMLAGLSFHRGEAWWQRGAAALVFLVFIAGYDRLGAALHAWSTAELDTLFSLNAFAVASLMAFIAIRYAGIRRDA